MEASFAATAYVRLLHVSSGGREKGCLAKSSITTIAMSALRTLETVQMESFAGSTPSLFRRPPQHVVTPMPRLRRIRLPETTAC